MEQETPILNGIEDWMLALRPEDLPEPYNDIARIGGVESAFIIARKYGGMMHYFKKLDAPLLVLRNKKIREEFNGQNYRDLARKYNRTETQIRTIVDQPDDKQLNLLDSPAPAQ